MDNLGIKMLHVLEQQHEQEHYTQYAKGTRSNGRKAIRYNFR